MKNAIKTVIRNNALFVIFEDAEIFKVLWPPPMTI